MSNLHNIPPFAIHLVDFFNHFVLFFLLPISSVVFCALVAAALALRIHRWLFARYATPEELLKDAIDQLKKNKRKAGVLNRPYPTSRDLSREKALDILRLVIRLQPHMLKPYIILATELFYGEISHDSDGRMQDRQKRRAGNNTALRRRGVKISEHPQQEVTNNLSPALVECEEIIRQGLCKDPQNESLLKLQKELQIVKEYGGDGAHAKMMNIGSFGWAS